MRRGEETSLALLCALSVDQMHRELQGEARLHADTLFTHLARLDPHVAEAALSDLLPCIGGASCRSAAAGSLISFLAWPERGHDTGAWHGPDGPGKACIGVARQGKAGSVRDGSGKAVLGMVGSGPERHGARLRPRRLGGSRDEFRRGRGRAGLGAERRGSVRQARARHGRRLRPPQNSVDSVRFGGAVHGAARCGLVRSG